MQSFIEIDSYLSYFYVIIFAQRYISVSKIFVIFSNVCIRIN